MYWTIPPAASISAARCLTSRSARRTESILVLYLSSNIADIASGTGIVFGLFSFAPFAFLLQMGIPSAVSFYGQTVGLPLRLVSVLSTWAL